MRDSARYVKIVEWSEEDGCYVGSSSGLLYGGCHGGDEKSVFEELCRIVDEVLIHEYRKFPFVDPELPTQLLPEG